MLAFLPAYLLACQPRLCQVETGTLGLHALTQGGLAGFAGPLLFTIAVRHLGAASASAFGGLTPSLASAFGMVLLGEFPSHATLLAGLVAGAGVVLVALAPVPAYAPASRARA